MNPDILIERIAAKTEFGDCWTWTGSTRSGYGRISMGKKLYTVHREAYRALVEDPGKLEVDHLCKNRACWNPDHLRLLTRSENAGKGVRRAQCKRGHLLLPKNRNANGACRTCNNERERLRYLGEVYA